MATRSERRIVTPTARRRERPPVQQAAPPPDITEIPEDDGENEYEALFSHGANRSRPIKIEDYTENVILQHAIEASIASSVQTIFDVERVADDDVEVFEDRKGKGIEQYGRKSRRRSFTEPSITERGEPSSARRLRRCPPVCPPPLTFVCGICMEAKLLSECSSIKGCTHLFCSDCIAQYVAAKVQENVTAIKCPQPGCRDGSLEPEVCRSILPVDVFDRWCTALCESLFVGEVRFYCPFKDCSALLIDESVSGSDGKKGDVITQSECPHCHRLFCAQCKVPWHPAVTCNEFQMLGLDERAREDIMLMKIAKKSKWQRCPKCKFYVERTDGCMFMSCRCGFRFCYGCASPMLIDHYCIKCQR
uniref:RBR-type E3 ubiquitin transferase n=2 Tax=Anthurium amnicola TaxID=1678845 RepID=A0A1D1ZFA8_9ARAE